MPFWVQDLDRESRSRIIHGLLGSHLRHPTQNTGRISNAPLTIGAPEATVLREMIEPRSGPPLFEAAALTVTRDELDALDRLTPLMGHTPRSIKRFVNVYQLVKIIRRSRASTGAGTPSDEQIAALLLAVAEGLPCLGPALLDEIGHCSSGTLSTVLGRPDLSSYGDELGRLNEWLNESQNGAFKDVPIVRLDQVASDVQRFVFRATSGSEPSPTLALPQLVHVIQQ